MKQLITAVSAENLQEVSSFIETSMQELSCPEKLLMKFCIAADEIYSNILYYSGAKESEIQCEAENGLFVLRFIDDGIPYDPLQQEEPDVTLSAEERRIGGLGIFMVKKIMKSVQYERKDGKNRLTLTASL